MPASVMQQFGLPAAGTCDEAAPESLNWAGVAAGGWSQSWGSWEGYAGPVCTRTISYSSSRGGWVAG
ncbi:MAG: hypothetical protein K9G24_01535 [Candidatus Nanopelagicales bacterium]|nr:hypothetical protein [Candidatus Nanopelagicales bacterium]MCF8556037.1 hypothetical protein [Candidatus Nanopelagicales bacterium]